MTNLQKLLKETGERRAKYEPQTDEEHDMRKLRAIVEVFQRCAKQRESCDSWERAEEIAGD